MTCVSMCATGATRTSMSRRRTWPGVIQQVYEAAKHNLANDPGNKYREKVRTNYAIWLKNMRGKRLDDFAHFMGCSKRGAKASIIGWLLTDFDHRADANYLCKILSYMKSDSSAVATLEIEAPFELIQEE